LGALAIGIYRLERAASRVRTPGDSPPPRSIVPVAGLRLAILFLALVVLLPQLRLSFEREGWPDVVILVDTSQSCGVEDDYQDEDVKKQAERLHQAWLEAADAKIKAVDEHIRQLNQERTGNPSPDRTAQIDRELNEAQEQLTELTSPSRLNLIKGLVAGPDRDW